MSTFGHFCELLFLPNCKNSFGGAYAVQMCTARINSKQSSTFYSRSAGKWNSIPRVNELVLKSESFTFQKVLLLSLDLCVCNTENT